MKHLYSLLLALFIVTSSNPSLAQQYVDVTNASSPSSCDGTAFFNAYTSYGPPMWSWHWEQDSTQIAGADSLITGLCPGNYALVLDSMGVSHYPYSFTIGDPCSNFSNSNSFNNCSPNSCDGSINFYPYGGSAPYTYMWSNGMTTQSATNLCPAVYTVTCADSYGCAQTVTFNISEDSIQYLAPNLSTTDDYGTDCMGQAWVSPTGGASPYSISWSTGDTTTFVDSLCAGIYSVTVWDSNMDSTSVSFVIADSTTLYGNDPYPNDPVLDTLYSYLVTNCEIDYNTIDSASLYQAAYESGSQSLYVTWVVYTSIDTNYINDTLGLAGDSGVYAVTISVYCPNKSVDDFFKIQSTIYFDGSTVSTLAVEENLLESITIYPNPFTDILSVDNTNGAIKALKLVDLNGRMISEMNQLNPGWIELKQLDAVYSGTYFLILSGETGSKAYKVIKN